MCLASVLPRLPKVDEAGHRVSVLGFVPMAWLLLLAVIVAAGFEQGALALLPVFGTDFGKGAVRWYSLKVVSVQPAEFLKPCFAVFTARRALISSETSADFSAPGNDGLARRQRRPFTTKYLPSGVTGCLSVMPSRRT
jgi:hypothetical protein